MIIISFYITGIYKITNKITGDFYIGSSVSVKSRWSNHMLRDARKYQGKHKFYDDVIMYGRDNFEFEILEECSKDDLIEKEQYYYDKLKPTYNKVRPERCNFNNLEVAKKARLNSNTPEHVKARKELYNTAEYKQLFRNVHTEKMKAVNMIKDNNILKSFISIQEASRYITETSNFKGVNKASKIKAVCDGERKSAYGYNWEYSNV